MVKVTVKWNKQTFSDLDLNTGAPVMEFKKRLEALTGVPVDRQKLMAKGGWKGILKDEEDLSKLTIKEGTQVMLMGTAEVVVAPTEKVMFVEDMTTSDAAKHGAVLPAGLVNLGNTCYMNSTLQCLRKVGELRDALTSYRPGTGGGDGQATQLLTLALRDTYNILDRSSESIPPFQFVQVLRQLYPQFAQQNQRGGYMQQDAEELYGAVTSALSENLREAGSLQNLGNARNAVDALFGLELEDTLTCAETDMETPTVSKDTTRKLVCNIQGGAGSTVQISHLHEGLRLGLEGSLEKRSEVLGRNAEWHKVSRISRLPRYLCVQFMRFFWKATPDNADRTGVKCKIMKAVTFPEVLDIYDFCTPKLKAILGVNREKDVDDILGKKPSGASKSEEEGGGGGGAAANQDVVMTDAGRDDDEAAALQAALAMSMSENPDAPPPVVNPKEAAGPGLPLNFKGKYEVFGIVTHKGRDADGGHYMGWVRDKGDNWLLFDDDNVSECKTEDIMKLSGGGDWHMAYMAFYRYKE